MKRIFSLILAMALILALAACGSKEAAPADLNAVYSSLEDKLPEMLVLDDTFRMNLLGIDSADCKQIITAICGDGLQADEVWLIEAKDAAALDRIKALAENRMKAKADETESYVPDQYLIVQHGVVLTKGMYLALLVSPEVSAMQAAFEEAVK